MMMIVTCITETRSVLRRQSISVFDIKTNWCYDQFSYGMQIILDVDILSHYGHIDNSHIQVVVVIWLVSLKYSSSYDHNRYQLENYDC